MGRRKKSSTIPFFLILLLIIVIGVISVFFWISSISKPASTSKEAISFIVKKGEGVDSIGARLEEEGIIRSKVAFKISVMKQGIAEKIQAGSFSLSPSLPVSDIANSLTSGRQDFWVTIIEGWRREEVAEALANSFIEVGIDFDQEAFLTATQGQEGMLFPDTYLLPLSISEAEVASLLVNTFNNKTSDLNISNQTLTLASLIEREARTDSSRKMVAGILQNRLDIGMALQVDATMQYVKGYNKTLDDWWVPPLAADKDLDSPYNTYKYPGLPPGPICSPSLSSIKAAINPTPNDYLYYITDNDGNMHYASTLEEHNQNVRNYLW